MGNCIRDSYNYELVEKCSKCNSICLKLTSVKIKPKKRWIKLPLQNLMINYIKNLMKTGWKQMLSFVKIVKEDVEFIMRWMVKWNHLQKIFLGISIDTYRMRVE